MADPLFLWGDEGFKSSSAKDELQKRQTDTTINSYTITEG